MMMDDLSGLQHPGWWNAAMNRLAAAGVAEPSTLVIEFMGCIPDSDDSLPRTAMSSRRSIDRSPLPASVRVFEAGLAPEYLTYEIESRGDPVAGLPPLPHELAGFDPARFWWVIRLKWVCRILTLAGAPVRRFVTTGTTHPQSDFLIDRTLVQWLADILHERITVRPCADVQATGERIVRQMRQEPDRFLSASQAIRQLSGYDRANPTVVTIRRRIDESRAFDRWLGQILPKT